MTRPYTPAAAGADRTLDLLVADAPRAEVAAPIEPSIVSRAPHTARRAIHALTPTRSMVIVVNRP